MSADDTWILVSVPTSRAAVLPLSRRLATRAGLGLLAWADRRHEQRARAVDLARVPRTTPAPRPFC